MSIEWKALRPHIPLSPGAPDYVGRPGSGAEQIVSWLMADRSPLLVGGAAGVGKSTELSRAAELLQRHRVACLIQLDRAENMRRLTPDRLLLRIAQRVGYLAQKVLHLPLSASLLGALENVDLALQPGQPWMDALGSGPASLAGATLLEVSRLSQQRRVTLLIDGLEKVPEGPEALELFDALAGLPPHVEQVVVIPWHFAFGPLAETVIRSGERFVMVRAVEVEGGAGEAGRAFLREMLAQRLQWNEAALDPSAIVSTLGPDLAEARAVAANRRGLVDDAISWSGGVPRTFLQLMADAGSYAKLRRPEAEGWPSGEDLNDAVADQVDSFRRLLLPGDSVAIRAAAGTSGTELDLDRKVRLMAHGILLERTRAGVPIIDIHPLAQAARGARSYGA